MRVSHRGRAALERAESFLEPDSPGHERWLGLWQGTLQLLRDQEPTAYRRVLAKLERHGLIGPAPAFSRVNGRIVAQERMAHLAGLLDADDPPAEVQRRVRAYAKDRTRVRPRPTTGRACPPRALLVMAYYAARWKAKQQTKAGPRLRGGESLEERALDLVAARFGFSAQGARSTVKHARASLPTPWLRWIKATKPETWWAVTMDPAVTLDVAKKGAVKS